MDEQAAFGKWYRDVASGFSGRAIGRAEYEFEGPSVLLIAQTRQDASDSRWIAEQRIEPTTPPPSGSTGF